MARGRGAEVEPETLPTDDGRPDHAGARPGPADPPTDARAAVRSGLPRPEPAARASSGRPAAGVVSALLGIGGGIIKVPLMHLAMGVPLRVATATSNMMIGITAAASAVIYLIRGGIDPYVAGPTAIGVFLGATAGSRLGHRVDLRYLRLLFVVVLVYTAIQMLLRGLAVSAADRPTPGLRRRAPQRPAAHRRSPTSRSACWSIGVVLMIANGISPLEPAPAARPRGRSSRRCSPSSPAAFLWLGLLAVIAAPIGRVIVAGVGYAADADWLMVGISLAILAGHRRSASARAIAVTV